MEPLSLAVCIPTYERCIILEDFLNQCYENYTSLGIDIYIYDSSISNETQELFHKWEARGHLYYVRMPSDMHPNVKAFRIFQGYGLEKDYDFILLSSDGLQHQKELLRKAVKNLNSDYDFIVLDWISGNRDESTVITDPDDLLTKSVYHSSCFGAVILNAHTMLHNANWSYFEKKFLVEPVIPWSHVGFYFERILEIKDFQCLCLLVPSKSVRYSMYKSDSCWTEKAFPYICEGWVKTMESLPSCYTQKDKAISEFARDYFTNIDCFLQYRRRGTYSFQTYRKYWEVWRKVTPVPRSALFFVALLPAGILNLWKEFVFRRKLSSLKRFCESHPKTLIYGKGTQGYLYGKCLLDHSIKLDGFCVSHPAAEGEKFMECPVYEFTEVVKKYPDVGYIVGVAPGNASEVVKNLQGAVKKSQIFFDLDFSNEIRYQYGYGFVAVK